MNNRKQTLAFARSIAIVGVAVGACQTESESLAPVEEGLHLSECFGTDTRCEPTVATETLAVPEARTCDGEVRTGMKVLALRDIMADVCARQGNETYCSSQGGLATAVSANGTIWLFHNTAAALRAANSLMNRPTCVGSAQCSFGARKVFLNGMARAVLQDRSQYKPLPDPG